MKVFASWSGTLSHEVAKLFKRLLEDVIQDAEVWLSSEDIQKGSVWPSEIYGALKKTDFGVLFLTQDNMAAPWVLFEAGAISQGLTENRVAPILIDFQPASLKPPLAQLNATVVAKAEVIKLIRDINECTSASRLSDDKLARAFEKYWPDFERDFQNALSLNKSVSPSQKRDDRELLEELLELNRTIFRRIEELKTNVSDIGTFPRLMPLLSSSTPLTDSQNSNFLEKYFGAGANEKAIDQQKLKLPNEKRD